MDLQSTHACEDSKIELDLSTIPSMTTPSHSRSGSVPNTCKQHNMPDYKINYVIPKHYCRERLRTSGRAMAKSNSSENVDRQFMETKFRRKFKLVGNLLSRH
eukprot:1547790-Amphidinium_carterae.1